jgi:hypothetical protein
MIKRFLSKQITERLSYFPALALLGPRQVGKTTLAKQIASEISTDIEYIDLEFPEDTLKLSDAALYLKRIENKIVIIDKIQRMPELFPILRSLIDQNNKAGRFILLGSASPDILKNASETLAGRISYLELMPFNLSEVGEDYEKHWLRGGFPKAYLAPNEEIWEIWFEDFRRTYVERDLPLLGMPANPKEIQRLLLMLSSIHGGIVNYNMLANSLGFSNKTVSRYIDFLENAFLVRRIQPYFANIGKRLTKSPKLYIRDSGFLHYLHGLNKVEDIFGNYMAGNSWEGYIIQEIINYLPINTQIYFYRTQDGAELDLVIQKGNNIKLAIEIKLSNTPKLKKGTTIALQDLNNPPLLVVTPSAKDYEIRENQFVCSANTLYNNMLKFL